MTPKKLSPRKLLVAAIGVATINYVVACQTPPSSGNLPAPEPPKDASTTPPTSDLPPTTGNLPAPEPPRDAAVRLPPTSGNLPAPMPADAGPTPRLTPKTTTTATPPTPPKK